VKLAVYNLLNQEKVREVDDELESDIGFINPEYGQGTSYQTPRYAQLTVSVNF